MKELLQTENLLLREFETTDATFIIELVNDPDWIRYIADKNIHDEAAAIAYIETLRANYVEFGFGFYCVVEKATNKAIGLCGLIKRPYLDLVDLGFAMLKEYRKKGLTFEACKAMMSYGHDELKFKKLAAITNVDNRASGSLLNKLGFHFSKVLELKEEDKEMVKIKYYTE